MKSLRLKKVKFGSSNTRRRNEIVQEGRPERASLLTFNSIE